MAAFNGVYETESFNRNCRCIANCITLVRIVIAPTATSPPYLSSDELKQTETMLSLDCITNVESPKAIQGVTYFKPVTRFSFLILSIVFLPVRNLTTQTQEMPCEIIVAKAAPRTPIFKPKIKIGSSTILQIAPISTVIMPSLAKPWAVINAFKPRVISTKIVPRA